MDKKFYSRSEPILLPYYPRLVFLSLLDLGHPEEQLFCGVDLSAEQLHDENYRLSIEQHERFILRALEVTDDPHLATRIGKMQDFSQANFALLTAANSGNIAKALRMIVRYNEILTRVFSIRTVETDDHAFMDIDSHLEHEAVLYFAMGAFVLFLDDFFVRVLKDAHLIERVEMTVPEPAGFAEVSAEFPFPVRFNHSRNRVYFYKGLLDRPMGQADPQTVRLLTEMSERQLVEAEAEMSLVGAVKSILIDQIASPPKLNQVAKMLGISDRGLRRKLAESGTTYQKILDSIRIKMGIKLLKETDEPISSIAYELGFSNASDFGRAFKRCSGLSPSSVRSGAVVQESKDQSH
ncbi:AraC family transcriptional regulator [Pseudomaricurvus alkylphenolicus]|uniref:AraC family transcriptional regulator n=1 Tax=Pseudomaricurvus alkylphenolicus TaxID=1306991 RepID=UPI00141DE713|nr:AraC family transcriptional regulator [Pseudomaricurvus alkylphenolicus]NIB41511.1 AraC family transcriptional regulator [Pseudomaricurvus alkylphenolicus]